MTKARIREKGATAIIVAGALIFLFGMAALAVDTSGFYQTARVDQTTADLTCLAGVRELPNSSKAYELAHAYAVANWPTLAAASAPTPGDPRAVNPVTGDVVEYDIESADTMSVTVTHHDPTTFGRVLGSESVTIRQHARCVREVFTPGGGMLPIGVLPGTFSHNLYSCDELGPSNCGAIRPDGNGASTFRTALQNGVSATLEKHHGPRDSTDPDTGRNVDNAGQNCPGSGPCNSFHSEPGWMSGPVGPQGIDVLLSKSPNCFGGSWNCDSFVDVVGSQRTLVQVFGGSAPDFWNADIYGSYNAVASSHYYHNGPMAACNSPRFTAVPIMTRNLDWGPLNPDHGPSLSGNSKVKIIGFYYAYIREPVERGDFDPPHSNGFAIDIVHFGPDATCNGAPLSLISPGTPYVAVKLISADAT